MKVFNFALSLLLTEGASAFSPFLSHNSGAESRELRSSFNLKSTSLRLSAVDIKDALKSGFDNLDASLKSVATSLDNFNVGINDKYRETLTAQLREIQALIDQEGTLGEQITKYMIDFSNIVDQWLLKQNPEVEAFFHKILGQLSALTLNTPEALGVATVVTYIAVSSVLTFLGCFIFFMIFSHFTLKKCKK